MAIDNQPGLPDYNSTLNPIHTAQYTIAEQNFIGKTNSSYLSVLVKREHFLSLRQLKQIFLPLTGDFTQPKERLAALKPEERARMVQNIADSLGQVQNKTVTLKQRKLQMCLRVLTHLILTFCFHSTWFSPVDVFATIDLTFAQDIAKAMGWTDEEIKKIHPLDPPDN